eukprot:TRINITY_DN75362_c0_g1_i1.p1 TRINITY_DN75362_c0_g1~~TRINITY_DN75362_c0_g1_i1.p1  ORF type:complete len:563 (-),score=95.17 TRINITY_DN75362_c0_g1_i1:169-1857(-)
MSSSVNASPLKSGTTGLLDRDGCNSAVVTASCTSSSNDISALESRVLRLEDDLAGVQQLLRGKILLELSDLKTHVDLLESDMAAPRVDRQTSSSKTVANTVADIVGKVGALEATICAEAEAREGLSRQVQNAMRDLVQQVEQGLVASQAALQTHSENMEETVKSLVRRVDESVQRQTIEVSEDALASLMRRIDDEVMKELTKQVRVGGVIDGLNKTQMPNHGVNRVVCSTPPHADMFPVKAAVPGHSEQGGFAAAAAAAVGRATHPGVREGCVTDVTDSPNVTAGAPFVVKAGSIGTPTTIHATGPAATIVPPKASHHQPSSVYKHQGPVVGHPAGMYPSQSTTPRQSTDSHRTQQSSTVGTDGTGVHGSTFSRIGQSPSQRFLSPARNSPEVNVNGVADLTPQIESAATKVVGGRTMQQTTSLASMATAARSPSPIPALPGARPPLHPNAHVGFSAAQNAAAGPLLAGRTSATTSPRVNSFPGGNGYNNGGTRSPGVSARSIVGGSPPVVHRATPTLPWPFAANGQQQTHGSMSPRSARVHMNNSPMLRHVGASASTPVLR